MYVYTRASGPQIILHGYDDYDSGGGNECERQEVNAIQPTAQTKTKIVHSESKSSTVLYMCVFTTNSNS